MLLVTLPAMAVVVVSLVFGKLVRLTSKRALFSYSMLLFLLSGIAPAFMNNITLILAMRGLFGVSMGVLVPLSSALIADFFEGSERATMMGLQGACVSIGGIVFQMLGGALAAISWQHTFFSYAFGIVIFLFVFFYLPEPPRLQAPTDNKQEKVPLPGAVWLLEISLFVFMTLYFSLFTNLAMVIVGDNLGNPASVGFSLMLFTVGGLLAGLLFGKITQAVQRFTIALGWILTGLGLALVASVYEFNLIVAGCFIAGVGVSITIPATFVRITVVAPPPATALAIALAYSFGGMGQFAGPLIFELVDNLFDQVTGRFPILVSALGITVVGWLSL
jgi:MFS family permease